MVDKTLHTNFVHHFIREYHPSQPIPFDVLLQGVIPQEIILMEATLREAIQWEDTPLEIIRY